MASGINAVQINDYNSERSTVRVRSTTITAANHDAQYAAFISFYDAMMAITLGLRVGATFGNEFPIVDASTPASDVNAQRERKWLVRYTDGTAMKSYKMEIPCADLTYLDANNREYADLTDTDVAAFVTAFEAFVLSQDGNAVTVDSIQHVGRNL